MNINVHNDTSSPNYEKSKAGYYVWLLFVAASYMLVQIVQPGHNIDRYLLIVLFLELISITADDPILWLQNVPQTTHIYFIEGREAVIMHLCTAAD